MNQAISQSWLGKDKYKAYLLFRTPGMLFAVDQDDSIFASVVGSAKDNGGPNKDM